MTPTFHPSRPVDLSTEKPQRIVFALVPGYCMISLMGMIEVLRSANRIANASLYRWELCSHFGQQVAASNGIIMPNIGNTLQSFDANMVIVCAGDRIQHYNNDVLISWLRRLVRTGTALGAAYTGSYILASAGLLCGYRCTIDREYLLAFTESFPDLGATGALYEIDRTRFTCGRGTISIDMMLTIIASRCGYALASAASEQMAHGRIRLSGDHAPSCTPAELGAYNRRLILAVKEMEANLETPLSSAELATRSQLSLRQIQRLFQKYFNCSPTQYYISRRLCRAHSLLLQTSLPITEIAVACGFTSPSHFTKVYGEQYGASPRNQRQKEAGIVHGNVRQK